jgi:hypothetical protein
MNIKNRIFTLFGLKKPNKTKKSADPIYVDIDDLLDKSSDTLPTNTTIPTNLSPIQEGDKNNPNLNYNTYPDFPSRKNTNEKPPSLKLNEYEEVKDPINNNIIPTTKKINLDAINCEENIYHTVYDCEPLNNAKDPTNNENNENKIKFDLFCKF